MKRRLYDLLLRHWYGAQPFWPLLPLSGLFVVITGLRRFLYRSRILLPAEVRVPVIVIGNLAVGGSGKTPFTLWLATALREAGFQPGIIARGYGGHSRQWPREVTPDSDAHQVGDEAVLLARRSGVPVVAGPDRVAAARRLLQVAKVNIILSDDGLQHHRLPRRAEIIMLDGARGLGNGWRLPAGPLRESARRLRQAEFVVVKTTGAPAASLPAQALAMKLAATEAVSLATDERRPLSSFAGQPVHAVAGIADPGQFFAMLGAQRLEVTGHALPDHAVPDLKELEFGDGLPVFMTEKDAVKCQAMKLAQHWYVPVTAQIDAAHAQTLLDGLRARITQFDARE